MKVAAITLVLLIGITACTQEQPTAKQGNTVSVTATGSVDVSPDTAAVQFNLSAQEKSAKAAYDRASKAAEQVRGMLRTANIDPASAQFGFFQLRPIYEYHGNKRKAVAYQANSRVVLKLKDLTKAGDILDQISSLDSAEDVTLNYTVENTEAAKKRAVDAAMARAKGEGEQVARTGGRTLGDILSVLVDTHERVPQRTMAAGLQKMEIDVLHTASDYNAKQQIAAPTEEFMPGNVTVTAVVSVVFGLK